MFRQGAPQRVPSPSPQQLADLRLAAAQMTGAKRRAFQAEMTVQYCASNARQAERMFGWGRETIDLGLAERRTGLICLGAQGASSGRKRWEAQPPRPLPRGVNSRRRRRNRTRRFAPRWPIRGSRLTPPWRPSEPKAIKRSNCPRPVRWPRCSIGWVFGGAKCSKRNRKRRWPRPTPSSITSKKRRLRGGLPNRQTLEYRL